MRLKIPIAKKFDGKGFFYGNGLKAYDDVFDVFKMSF
jgi:hypothetical protein